MSTHDKQQETTFYEELQKRKNINLRDNRGKRHDMGTKESEKPCLQNLIEQSGAKSQEITADELHLHPSLTQIIEQEGGVFLIGLKENQKELLQDMQDHVECFKPVDKKLTIDKGHGRLESRQYYQYDISEEYFSPRWNASHFRTLIQVNRSRINLKTKEQSDELAFYISNGEAEQDHGYFDAIRGHWSVEVNNHIRDVSLKEDLFKTKKSLLLAS